MKIFELIFTLQERDVPGDGGWSKEPIRRASQIYSMMRWTVSLPEEHLWVLPLDERRRAIGLVEIAKGKANTAGFSPRSVMAAVLTLPGAESFLMIHNHPMGVAIPSFQDIDCTNRLRKICEEIGIELIDHVVIGTDGFQTIIHPMRKKP